MVLLTKMDIETIELSDVTQTQKVEFYPGKHLQQPKSQKAY